MNKILCVVFTDDAPVHLLGEQESLRITNLPGMTGEHWAMMCVEVTPSTVPGFVELKPITHARTEPLHPLVVMQAKHILCWMEGVKLPGYGEPPLLPRQAIESKKARKVLKKA